MNSNNNNQSTASSHKKGKRPATRTMRPPPNEGTSNNNHNINNNNAATVGRRRAKMSSGIEGIEGIATDVDNNVGLGQEEHGPRAVANGDDNNNNLQAKHTQVLETIQYLQSENARLSAEIAVAKQQEVAACQKRDVELLLYGLDEEKNQQSVISLQAEVAKSLQIEAQLN